MGEKGDILCVSVCISRVKGWGWGDLQVCGVTDGGFACLGWKRGSVRFAYVWGEGVSLWRTAYEWRGM